MFYVCYIKSVKVIKRQIMKWLMSFCQRVKLGGCSVTPPSLLHSASGRKCCRINFNVSSILSHFLPNPAEEFPLRSSLCTYSGFYLFVVIESISAVTAFIAVLLTLTLVLVDLGATSAIKQVAQSVIGWLSFQLQCSPWLAAHILTFVQQLVCRAKQKCWAHVIKMVLSRQHPLRLHPD